MKNIDKRIAFCTLAFLLPLLAATTVAEQLAGRELVDARVYGSWWFVIAWAVSGAAALAYMLRVSFYRRRVLFLFHVALLLVLVGAGVTRVAAERGSVHLRQGAVAGAYFLEEGDARALPFTIKLLLFDIEYSPATGSPVDYHAYLQLDGQTCRAAMNAPVARDGYRLYIHDHDLDEMGVALLVNRDPWGGGVTRVAYILLGLAICALACRQRVMLYALLPLAVAWTCIARLDVETPVLRTPFLAVHVSLFVVAYLLLAVIFFIALVALARPGLRERLHRFSARLLLPAVLFMVAGIFTGAAWAGISWGRYWGWDAKETWALVTLLLYAFPLHSRVLPFFRSPSRYHLYCAIVFLAVLMTSIGVTFFLGGLHAYI
ncbi:MAG: cytochrome c biogenesis protein CcsA [Odoribacteraceae bacterium]|jgi:hypothetical protein|nr:cytochrome c biogenesis protein CcsA [Odoribacteraceae bacterium]